MNLFKKNKNDTSKELLDTSPSGGRSVIELLKKVRELEIKSKRLTNHLFTGEYHTAFKGRGMTFKEVRELSVYMLVDVSASSLFGTYKQTKRDLTTEICAVLAFSAISNNDKAGIILYSNKVEKYIPAKKGKDHVLYMVRELITHQPHSAQTDIIKALNFLNGITKHKSIVFILSDFADAGYHQALRVAAKR